MRALSQGRLSESDAELLLRLLSDLVRRMSALLPGRLEVHAELEQAGARETPDTCAFSHPCSSSPLSHARPLGSSPSLGRSRPPRRHPSHLSSAPSAFRLSGVRPCALRCSAALSTPRT